MTTIYLLVHSFYFLPPINAHHRAERCSTLHIFYTNVRVFLENKIHHQFTCHHSVYFSVPMGELLSLVVGFYTYFKNNQVIGLYKPHLLPGP